MSSTKDKLLSLARKDPLAYGVVFISLGQDKQWEIGTRTWVKDIYATVNPWEIERHPVGTCRRLVVTKSTQSGISTLALTKALHFATNWPVRIGYTLPRQQDVLDMVGTRFDEMIQASAYLRELLGNPDSTHVKKIGGSYIYFMELSVEARMLPLDALYIDEVDLSNPDNMASLLNRLDASRWKMTTYLSTPTIPNYGINGLYINSDMREWLVKCPKCGKEQPMDWELNLRVVGPQNRPDKVFYGCSACSAELTVEHIQTGRWVAEHPELSNDTIGFHIHQMLTTPAPELYANFRDPQQKLVEFYRKRLGKPHEIGGGSLTRDDILASCFDEPYEFESVSDGRSTYYMGVDQGNELQILVCKVPPNSRRPKIVHVELVPLSRGFDRVCQLIDLFHVRRTIIDANPNRHSAISVMKKFPARVYIADYIEQQRQPYIVKKGGLEADKSINTNIVINRTTGFDDLMDSIKKGQWQLPGQPPTLSTDVELLIDHVTSLKRDIETRRTGSTETQVAVWRKLRADHLAHSWLYMKLAMDSMTGHSGRMAVIGQEVAKAEEKFDDGLTKDTVKEVVYYLAEVPLEQLREYLEHDTNDAGYSIPFPLSYKLTRALENGHTIEVIETVMVRMTSRLSGTIDVK